VTSDLIQVDQRKWPDREHYQFEVSLLGRDAYGTWVIAAAGTVVRRGSDEPWPMPGGFVGLVPDDEWWVASFYSAHPEVDIYVDIGTPPVWKGRRLTYIDLDLDVIRRLNGTVQIIDEDEFEENRIAHSYPQEMVDGARAAADHVARLIRNSSEPFGSVFMEWVAKVDPARLTRRDP
jgi:uncharacterized protein